MQAPSLPHAYLGRWERGRFGSLVPPEAAAGGYNVLSWETPRLGGQMLCFYETARPASAFDASFGNDYQALLPVAQRDLLPFNPSSLNLSNIIAEIFTDKYDVTGVTGPRPILGSKRKGFGAYIGHNVRLNFVGQSRRLTLKVAQYQEDYKQKRALAQNQRDLDVLRRLTGFLMLEENLTVDQVLAPEFLNDGFLRPGTTVTDDFGNGTLTNWTEDGDSGNWSESGGQCHMNDTSEAAKFLRWTGTALSGSSLYCEAWLQDNDAAYAMGVCTRKDGATNTMYGGGHGSSWTGYVIWEVTTGTPVAIADQGTSQDAWYYRLDTQDSDQELFADSTAAPTTSRATATDSDIGANTDVGFMGAGNFGSPDWDDFEASDGLGGGPGVDELMAARQGGQLQPVQMPVGVISY